jgi:hypothetical protein
MDVARMVLSGMWLQDPDSLSSGNSRLLMIFVAMVAIAMVAQAVALIVMAIGAAKARKQGIDMLREISESIQRGIKIPVREVTGLVNGLKAGLDVLVGRAKGFGIGRADVPRDRDRGW